ncbi:MAG: hypothetical protein MRZ79_26460 [Bacteroidia bacterium]|nr:hypothetical protein [Bacteroidia bacterium]
MKKFEVVREQWVLLMLIVLAVHPTFSLGQEYQVLELRQTRITRGIHQVISAESYVHCDGKNISVHVRVDDPELNLNKLSSKSDQIRVWLALENSAYPQRFGYDLHSDYIAYLAPASTTENTLRFFSTDEAVNPDSRIDEIFQDSDYPKNSKSSLNVPPILDLTEANVPFGMVGFAFFPDNRPAEWINEENMIVLEDALGLQLAQLNDSIKYVAEIDKNKGYSLDISFPPSSLGFVQLPEMNRIRMLVEVWNGSDEEAGASLRLSSSEERIAGRPSTFNSLDLKKPLQTNFSGIPKEIFYKINFFPTYIYTESEWTPASVDVDALVFLPKQTSENLTEVKFYKQMLDYDRSIYNGYAVETLRVQHDYVNQVSKEKAYTLVNNQLITSEKAPYLISDPQNIRTGFFVFPDGDLGLIVKNSFPVDPFGWENCETCVEERINILKISPFGQQTLLKIEQGEGKNSYCRVGDLEFDEFYLAAIDWIKEGRVMVLGLNHQYLKEKRRVKVSWKDDGSDVKLKIID